MKCSTILATVAILSLLAVTSARAGDGDGASIACSDAEVQAPPPGDGWTSSPPTNAGVRCRWIEHHPSAGDSIIEVTVDPAPAPADPAGWLDATLAPLVVDGYHLGDKAKLGRSGATIEYTDLDASTRFLQAAVRGPHGRVFSAQLRCPLPTAWDEDREALLHVAGGLRGSRSSGHRGS